MVERARILRIVVASPGDVQAERDSVQAVAEELNRGLGKFFNFRLEVCRWETDAHPGFHPEGPQGIIDPILRIQDCDVLVGIFWKRFGTVTKDGTTGTQHEFHRAYEAWRQNGSPQIMFYFNQRPYTLKSSDEAGQVGQVLEFRKNFPEEGLSWSYRRKNEFEKLVREHLNSFVLERFRTYLIQSGAAAASAESQAERGGYGGRG